MAVLNLATVIFPVTTSWWKKGDAVDLIAGLGESVSGDWSCDVYLGTDQLQGRFKQYQRRLLDRTDRHHIAADLQQDLALLESDLEFLCESILYYAL